MITILTSFKPFRGNDAVRQRNALTSWRRLDPELEIIAFGKSEGLNSVADEWGVKHVGDIPCFEGRLPRIDAVLAYGQRHGRHDVQVYLNGDIILCPGFLKVVNTIPFPKWLLIGQRLDIEVDEELQFEDPPQNLQSKLLAASSLHDIGGIDYFAYRRGSLPPLPPLYLGAATWDNLVIYYCRRAGIPVIDATQALTVLHQDHEDRYLPDGRSDTYEGPAAIRNRKQIPEPLCCFYTTDASHWIDSNGRLRSALMSPWHAWRAVLTWPILRNWPKPARLPFRIAAASVRRLGLAWIWLYKHLGQE